MLEKPRPRFLMLSFTLLSLLVMILGACGAPSSPSGSSTTSNAGTPVQGGTWIDDFFEEPDTLLPNSSQETFGNMAQYLTWSALLVGVKGQMSPGLATEVPTVQNGDVSADLKTWTFKLRPNLVWSDGQPLNADDVDFTWKLWKGGKYPTYSTNAVTDITSADVSADKLSITFHLKDPFVAFASYWTDGGYGIMPKHHYEGMDPAGLSKSDENLHPQVVSGPFMVSEVKPGDHYTFVRNPKYYQAPKPYLDKFVIRVVPDQNTILKDFQAGTIDSSWFLDVSKALAYEKLQGYHVVADPNTANFEAIYFNFNNKILGQNREVRQAISMAVDQQTLIQVARRGLGGPLCTEHSKVSNPGYQADAPCPKFDLDAANKLLDDNGWKKGADGVRTKNGQRLEFQYSTTAGNLWRSDDELINQNNFKQIGVKINIQNYPASTLFTTFVTDKKPGVFDMVEYATSVGYDPDDSTLFGCGLPSNNTGYCNKELDKLYAQQLATGDNAKRQQIFNQIHQIDLTDFPFVVEFSAPDVAVVKSIGHNYAPSPVGAGETVTVWDWWCDGGKC